MDKLKYIKLENQDGSYSDNIPIAVDANYVDVNGADLITELDKKALKTEVNVLSNELNEKVSRNEADILYNQINILDNKIDTVANGSPLSANSISEMTNTQKIYVNTTNGHWYYYNGNSWEDGGVYQATQLENNSVDILVLNENLSDNFVMSFGDFETLENEVDNKYPINNNGVIGTASATSYKYFVINLTKGNIYNFTMSDKDSITGLFITDSEDNIIYSSNNDHPENRRMSSLIVKAKSVGLKAYLTKFKSASLVDNVASYQNPTYRILNKVTNKLSLDLTPKELLSYDGKRTYYDSETGKLKITNDEYASVKMYAIDKGKKYKFKTFSYNIYKGLIITDSNYMLQYTVPYSANRIYIDYTYEALENGFAFLTSYSTIYSSASSTIEVVNETIENLKEEIGIERMGFTNWYVIGDSITAKNEYAAKNYIDYIVEDIPLINAINLGRSGSGYKNPTSSQTPDSFINRISQISEYDLNTDIITVMGSINDLNYVADSLGQLGDTTTDTVYGAMYAFFNTLFTQFNGVRVGCISPITAKEYTSQKTKWESYFTALKETCELFNVPFLDVLHTGNLRPNNTTFLNEYYAADGQGGDGEIGTGGVHPNSKGHRLLYQRIKEFIKTL